MSTGSQFIDVDLSVPPPGQGGGLIEQPPAELLASYADVPWFDEICASEMIPRSQWPSLSAERWPEQRKTIGPIQSQGNTGSCVGHAVAKAISMTLFARYGWQYYVECSGMSIYDQIGRTVSSGAYIPDGIAYATSTGPLPLRGGTNADKYPVTFPGVTWRWSRPSGWQAVAGLFKIVKSAKVQGAEMMVSAVLNNRKVIVGRSQHAIPYCGYRHPQCAYANSWGGSWSDQGIGYDSENTFRNLVGYVILEVAFRPDIVLPTPIV